MAKVSTLKNSKFLTRADCGEGILVTIERVGEENIAKDGAPPEHKHCVYFVGHEKPMVLNSTNGQLIEGIAAKAGIVEPDEMDNWGGLKIVLYDDPSIPFQGKLVGGIRVRAPKPRPVTAGVPSPALTKPRPAPSPAPLPALVAVGEATEDEVPF